jgi:hypothetical protein
LKWADETCTDVGEDCRYLLVLSGHGSGTTEDFLMRDESAMDSLTIDELEKALAGANQAFGARHSQPGRKIDVLGLDACYMCMGEVAYQIRKQVGILIGAEGLEPEFGWPYRKILAQARSHRSQHPLDAVTPGEMAQTIVGTYVEHYHDYDRSAGRSADLAAIDLAKIEGVKTSFATLVSQLGTLDKPGHEKLLLAHWYAQTYKYDQFVDLKDVHQVTVQFGGNQPIVDRCAGVVKSLEACV